MSQSNLLSKCLTREQVLRLAGEHYFERGLSYFRQGRVTEFEDFGESVEAIVEGTEEYVVRLECKSKGLEHDCNCPLGEDGEFCKHCVAVALKWMSAQEKEPSAEPAGTAKPAKAVKITDDDIAGALNAADKATLVKLLLEWAEENEPLREKLVHLAARSKGPEVSAALARKTLEKAIRIRRFVDYREMRAYAKGARTAIDLVEELLRCGQAAGVIDLCEAGVRWLAAACEQVDDSDGYMSELMERLEDLHLRACAEAKPNPALLAAKLFHGEMSDGYGLWTNCLEKYAEVLGAEGLAAYRALAEAAWAKVPVKTTADYGKESYSGIARIMETLARQSGDVEALVAVLERDLSSTHRYLRIAEEYRAAGDRDKALAWAERGVAASTGTDGAMLRRFVAEEYRHRDRHADALRIIWIEFRESPSLQAYQRLEDFARAAEDWDDWRGQALALVRKTVAAEGAKPALRTSWSYRRRDHSLLVEIFLHEGSADEAWAEAQSGGCDERLWLQLADLRKKNYPADAKAVFLRFAEQAIAKESGGKYDDAVHLLERAAAAAQVMGKSMQFHTELDALLLNYKVKRNLHKRVAVRREHLYLNTVAR